MIPIMDAGEYLARVMDLPRPGGEKLLACYEHRLGALVTDPRLMLAPLDDHMFLRGDGVFEAMKYVQRRIYQLDEHLARMRRSASAVGIVPPCSWDELRELVLQICRQVADGSSCACEQATLTDAGTTTANSTGKIEVASPHPGSENGMIRLFLGRGPGGFGVDPAECPEASLYIVISRFAPRPESWYAKGQSGFRTSVPAKPAYLSQIKDTNYLSAVLMTMEAHSKGKDIPLCFDSDGFLAESAIANICLVDRAGKLVAPEFRHALPGTTIRRAMALLDEHDAQEGKASRCVIRRIPEAEIYDAAEVLLLGTSPDCSSITEYEGKPIGNGSPGPVAALLRKLIRKDIERNG
ncbi:aminotransferase class IV, partial [Desulfovibrio sp. OttesenSCG-928-C06]|nr:aminotransferase class IV [Desulfovibrio sp. OttesenSCG-928-C06]